MMSDTYLSYILLCVHSLCKKLIPHPLYDPTDFGSLSDLVGITTKEGLVVVTYYIANWLATFIVV